MVSFCRDFADIVILKSPGVGGGGRRVRRGRLLVTLVPMLETETCPKQCARNIKTDALFTVLS